MELEWVDPHELEIDDINERSSNIGARTEEGDLEKSIRDDGVDQPVQARRVDGELKVFAGQRRTHAAQAVGKDKIPVLIQDVDDTEALAKSISENEQHLSKNVLPKDRAKSTRKLVEMMGSPSAAADRLGLTEETIERRLERTRSFWKSTPEAVDSDDEEDSTNLPDDILQGIRKTCYRTEQATEVIGFIKNEKISRKAVRSAISTADSKDELVEKLQGPDQDGDEVSRVDVSISIEGRDAETILNWCQYRGASKQQAAEQLLEEKLGELEEFRPEKPEQASLSDIAEKEGW